MLQVLPLFPLILIINILCIEITPIYNVETLSLNTTKVMDLCDAEMPQAFPLSPLLHINITKKKKKKRRCEIETIFLKTHICKLSCIGI